MSLAVALTSLALAVIIARGVYLSHFHPLARYPGPWFARLSDAWFVLTLLFSLNKDLELTRSGDSVHSSVASIT
jgi:hypothetical protein